MGFIWGGFTIISIPFVYFLVPEMQGLTLEQIDRAFEERVSARKFREFLRGIQDEEAVGVIEGSPSGSVGKAESMEK